MVTPNVGIDGGVARHVRESVAALEAAGETVAVAASDAPEAALELRGLTASTDQADHVRHRLRVVLGEWGPDVVHFHNADDPVLVGETASRFRTFVSAHGWPGCGPNTLHLDAQHPCSRRHGIGCIGGIALGCGQRRNVVRSLRSLAEARRRLQALRVAHGVIAYSAAVRDHLARNELEDVSIVPMPIREASPLALPDPAPPRVLFVGRLSPEKGVAVLLRALVGTPFGVTIAGDGHQAASLREMAIALGVDATFTGWLGDTELEEQTARSSVVCMPHVWPEPFGLVGPETLARGRPVIASRTGGTGEWLQPEVTGIAVAPGRPDALRDALVRLLGDRDRIAAMGTRGRADMLARFSPQNHADALRATYVAGGVSG